MTMQLGADGYYYMPGDGTPYYYRSDGNWHPVIEIQDITGRFSRKKDNIAKFLKLMMESNNSFHNKAGELVVFTRAKVVTDLHASSSLTDPNSHLGIPHFGIQLTNDHLHMNDGTTHMYHFRPSHPELSVFFPKPWTRKQVAKSQDKSQAHKSNKKDPPSGGGHGIKSGSSKTSSSKGSSSKDATSKSSSSKGSSSKSSASKTGPSKGHTSKAGHFRLPNDDDYGLAATAALAGNMSHFDEQFGKNLIFSVPRPCIHTYLGNQQAANATHGPSIDRPEASTYVTGSLLDVRRLCRLMRVIS